VSGAKGIGLLIFFRPFLPKKQGKWMGRVDIPSTCWEKGSRLPGKRKIRDNGPPPARKTKKKKEERKIEIDNSGFNS